MSQIEFCYFVTMGPGLINFRMVKTLVYQGLFKRSQHVGPTSSPLLDATCWRRLNTMLDDVGRCWLEFKLT